MFVLGDQLFWIVCAIFYVLDNIRRVGPRQIILSEASSGGWTPSFPLPWYRLGGRPVIVLPLYSPWRITVNMGLLTADAFATDNLRRSERSLRMYCKHLLPYRVISAMLFAAFFVAGPVTSYFFGLAYALAFVLSLYLIVLIVFITILISGRRFWRMTWPQLTVFAAECALCPGFFINVCRKIALGYARVPGDALALASLHGGKHAVHGLEAKLTLYLEDLREHRELRQGDELLIEEYRASLRA